MRSPDLSGLFFCIFSNTMLKYLSISEDKSIAYIDEGNSEQVLLFIHGMGSTSAIWKNMLQGLSKEYRCIALDLPEHGSSYYTGNAFSLTQLAEDVYHFIEALSIKSQVVLIGHSMGAQISFILSLRYPNLFSRLIVLAPAGIESFSKQEIKIIEMSSQMLGLFTRQSISQLTGELSPQAKYVKVMKLSSKAMLNEPVHTFLPSISIPTLIVFGTKDQFIPNKLTKNKKTEDIAITAKKLIPKSVLVLLENKGHFLPLDAVKECNEHIVGFIQS